MRRLAPTVLLVLPTLVTAIYNPLREYAGDKFFDGFAYYNNVDNTTWGNVTYVDKQTAMTSKLTFINGAGNAVVQVDNTSNIVAGPPGEAVNRNSIRLTSLDSYGLGSLLIIDALHIPYGCSVWPAFWTYGIQTEWPGSGEIDIIEAINGMNNNQIALHTLQGCFKQEVPNSQEGTTLEGDCSTPRGCIVAEQKPNSYGPGFATAGGGVYAVQMEATGIYIWFWSRADVPASIASATSTSTMDTSTWGLPSAAYPSGQSCNITQFFPPQNLVLLTTLCGVWAGAPSIYSSTCHTPTNNCYVDNILGSGANYINAYWEIKYIRTYLSDAVGPVPSSSSSSSATASPTGPVTTTDIVTLTPTPSPKPTSGTSDAIRLSSFSGLGALLLLAVLSSVGFIWN